MEGDEGSARLRVLEVSLWGPVLKGEGRGLGAGACWIWSHLSAQASILCDILRLEP